MAAAVLTCLSCCTFRTQSEDCSFLSSWRTENGYLTSFRKDKAINFLRTFVADYEQYNYNVRKMDIHYEYNSVSTV